ncbi:MAG: symmetrical bis(5'-nucleosyl)-tetraphosphatase [Betaproteobacteria bacterium]|nr:symmetrical bis(5'-nucleosyl)-tetraphosphatase [Betaproteobacteria bacterium]
MATYVIGDVQGCYRTLRALLRAIGFAAGQDRLWFAGDLVNRGPDSLACLRFVRDLGDRAVSVLGNHDLHLLAVAHGIRKRGADDTVKGILDAPDLPELLAWLRGLPLLHAEAEFTLVHAAIPPSWSPQVAQASARDVESTLRGSGYEALLRAMYGNHPARWEEARTPVERQRFTINALTRARAFGADGAMDLRFKGTPEDLPEGLTPWYMTLGSAWRQRCVLAGHWSAAGVRTGPGYVTLDSGCVWGGALTAYCLERASLTSVPCASGDQAGTIE